MTGIVFARILKLLQLEDLKEKLCPDQSKDKENIEVAIEQTSSLFDLIKHSPIDLNHPSVSKDSEKSSINKVMLNMHDNGRCFHFDPSSKHHIDNAGKIPNLLWLKFHDQKDPKTNFIDLLTLELQSYGLNFHCQKDTSSSLIIKLEDTANKKAEDVITNIINNHKSDKVEKVMLYEEV